MSHKFSFRSKKKLQKLNIASRILIISIALFLPISQTFASIDNETLKFYAKNNILYYDPTGNIRDCTGSYSAKPSGDQITWIGDSYSVGSEDSKKLISNKFPGVDYGSSINNSSSYIQDSKFVSQGTTDNPSGLTILKNIVDANNLRPYLVFALGTNGGWTDQNINELIGLVGTETKVILVTSRTESSADYTESNKRIKKAAEDNKNIFVADWASSSAYKSEYYASDPGKIHPSASGGFEAWVDVIYNALPSGSAQATTGSTAQEIIWSFFINQGFNEIQVAGIMGNAYVESNYTPSAHSSGNPHYWGLFQWGDDNTAGEAWKKLYSILKQKGYAKYVDDSKYWAYLTTNAEGKLMPLEDLRGMLEVEMQFAMEYGGAHGTSWIEKIKEADTIPLATEIFLVELEGATGIGHNGDGYISYYSKYKGKAYQDVQKRIAAAEDAYSKFTGYEVSPGQNVICDPSTISTSPGDALSYLQQYVRDANYLYNTNATVPTVAKYYDADDPSTFTIVERKKSINKTNLANMSDLSKEDKDYLSTVGNCFGGADCGQCTALSGWFVIMFTNYKYGGGAGVSVVTNLVANNSELHVSTTPTPWSIFSYGDGGNGHTGIVMDVTDSGEIITLEHNMAASRGGKRLTMRKYNPDTTGHNYSYVDLRSGLDFNHLGKTYE